MLADFCHGWSRDEHNLESIFAMSITTAKRRQILKVYDATKIDDLSEKKRYL